MHFDLIVVYSRAVAQRLGIHGPGAEPFTHRRRRSCRCRDERKHDKQRKPMTGVKKDGNGCESGSWRMVGVNHTDDDKRRMASTAIPRPLPKNLTPVPTAAPQTEPTINAYG